MLKGLTPVASGADGIEHALLVPRAHDAGRYMLVRVSALQPVELFSPGLWCKGDCKGPVVVKNENAPTRCKLVPRTI